MKQQPRSRELISGQAYEQALTRGREALARPHAVRATYNKRTHMLTVVFSNRFQCALDVRYAPVLQYRPDADLSDPYVTPGGDGLIFEKAGMAVGLPALVSPFLTPEIGQHWMASHQGRKRSPAKAAAARANGAKGGRPRKAEGKPAHALAKAASGKEKKSGK